MGPNRGKGGTYQNTLSRNQAHLISYDLVKNSLPDKLIKPYIFINDSRKRSAACAAISLSQNENAHLVNRVWTKLLSVDASSCKMLRHTPVIINGR